MSGSSKSKGIIIGASLGNCVHVAGVVNFLRLAEDEGYETVFLGPAIGVDSVIASVEAHKPLMVALGYRLTPENGAKIVRELVEKSANLAHKPSQWLFGGTAPVAEKVRELGFFDAVFDGNDDIDDCISFLRTGKLAEKGGAEMYATDLVGRIAQKKPYPLLRHHFGLPSFEDTVDGIGEIAQARVLDVVSLGIDQNTQQYFFHPEARRAELDGAGGVPVYDESGFEKLKEASLCGNYPLMRCYSGTADVIRLAETLNRTIANAWCAVPLFWYNELDGRGGRPLKTSIEEAQDLIAYHARLGIPVELNEPHHWGLRDSHDVISAAASYISAYNAKKLGVRDYISQYMFNIPSSMSFSMDLAKVLAQIELTESLADKDFRVYRQTRAGLPFLVGDSAVAKGQLAASTALSMNVRPHIIHVVGYSEAIHAATPDVVVESCKIVRGVVRSCLQGNADAAHDPRVAQRRAEIVSEAKYLLGFIKDAYSAASPDPLADSSVLADCVKRGILDAPHIVKNNEYRGTLQTRIIEGKCVAWDAKRKCPMDERTRLAHVNGNTVFLSPRHCETPTGVAAIQMPAS